MQTTHRRADGVDQNTGPQFARTAMLAGLFVMLFTFAGCAGAASETKGASRERERGVREIAAQYATDSDLAKAGSALAQLGIANPVQFVLSMAEQSIAAGAANEDTLQLVELAEALGARSPQLVAFKASMATPVPASPIPAPTAPPVELPSLTPLPSATTTPAASPASAPTTAPTVPSTASPAPTAVAVNPTVAPPRVAAANAVNLRGGPGTQFPVIGRMQAGQELLIIGRNDSGDWWRLEWPGPQQAWVAGTVVKVLGPIDTVAIAQNIPTPPPPPTRAPTAVPPPTGDASAPTDVAPAPTTAPAAPPRPATAYSVKSVRLRPLGQDAQQCHGGENSIWAYVVDAAGNRLDGVRVREIFTGIIHVTGDQGKGPGAVQWDTYRGGGGQLEIVDENNNRISDVTRGMSADWPDFDLMRDAGYCSCKPHPDEASCESDLVNHAYLFAVGHYTYEVVFQRNY